MRHLFPLFLVLSCLLTFLPGCEPKEDLVQTSGSLAFATDTVKFDTVFTTIQTVTKRLWVYNRNSGAVKTDVSLAGKLGTTYSLIINGDACCHQWHHHPGQRQPAGAGARRAGRQRQRQAFSAGRPG